LNTNPSHLPSGSTPIEGVDLLHQPDPHNIVLTYLCFGTWGFKEFLSVEEALHYAVKHTLNGDFSAQAVWRREPRQCLVSHDRLLDYIINDGA